MELIKFLVTGSSGLVGSHLVKELTQKGYETYSCYHNLKSNNGIPIKLDLVNSKIQDTLNKIQPDVIIHLAAMTNVDLCEKEKEMATKVNVSATETISKVAEKYGIFLIYVSTDYVFDGTKGLRKESDITNPLGFYGKTKLEGEKVVQNSRSKWCIARTSTPFGIHPIKKSFPLWVIENLKLKKELRIISDQYTSPTYVPNLNKMLVEISEKKISGIIHTAGASRISRYDFAKLIVDKLDLDCNLLKPISIDDMDWKAPRPRDSSLDVSLAEKILEQKPMDVKIGLDLFLKDII